MTSSSWGSCMEFPHKVRPQILSNYNLRMIVDLHCCFHPVFYRWQYSRWLLRHIFHRGVSVLLATSICGTEVHYVWMTTLILILLTCINWERCVPSLISCARPRSPYGQPPNCQHAQTCIGPAPLQVERWLFQWSRMLLRQMWCSRTPSDHSRYFTRKDRWTSFSVFWKRAENWGNFVMGRSHSCFSEPI